MTKITLLLFLSLQLFAISQIKIICDRDAEEIYLDGKFKSGDGVSKVIEAKTTPLYSEYHYFDTARKNESLDDCNHYKEKYPHGKYIKEIEELELNIKAKKDFRLFREYFKTYPKGAYGKKLINYYNENPLVATLKGHRDWAYALATSKDDTTLYSVGTNDGKIKVWDIDSLSLIREYSVDDRNGLDYITLSPYEKKALTSSSKLRVWDLINGSHKTLNVHMYSAKTFYIDKEHFAGADDVSFKIVNIPQERTLVTMIQKKEDI